nr:hypothetical protein [Acinetobacter baumannii]
LRNAHPINLLLVKIMFIEKFKQIQFSPLELISAISFIGLCYCLFYKYFFYKTLGIPWFITNLSPQYIFFASLKLLIIAIANLIIGLIIGFWGSKFISERSKIGPSPILLFSMIFYFFIFTAFKSILPEYIFSFKTSDILFSYLCFNFGGYAGLFLHQITLKDYFINDNFAIFRLIFKIKLNDYKRIISIFSSFFLIIFFIIQPIYFGQTEASKILKHKELYLNKVLLKDTIKDWYLIESMGDKVLLIDRKNNIKIVEYKELDFIQTDQQIK